MVFFIFIQILIEHYVSSEDPDQMPSDLGLHCLPMSRKKEAWLIWVKNLTNVTLTILRPLD